MSSALHQITLLDAATPMKCSSCNRLMQPHEAGVEFNCPRCGRGVIRRCYRCRKQSVKYKCPVCGFEGP